MGEINMEGFQRYRKKTGQAVVAIQLNLDSEGLIYKKWGGEQKGKRGDWLVDNQGDVYTVDAEVFAGTYRKVGSGQYVKTTPLWAKAATTAGTIKTKEGSSNYNPGDYLVYNDPSGTDGYCMSAEKFKAMYEEDE